MQLIIYRSLFTAGLERRGCGCCGRRIHSSQWRGLWRHHVVSEGGSARSSVQQSWADTPVWLHHCHVWQYDQYVHAVARSLARFIVSVLRPSVRPLCRPIRLINNCTCTYWPSSIGFPFVVVLRRAVVWYCHTRL